MFHRETDAAKVARNRDAIFDLHAAALAWLEQYTGIPYPFGKFDFVLVPAFQFGGMEHPGAIFYNASGLLLDETATQNQLLGRASVIAHETCAHVVRRSRDDALVQRRVDEGGLRQLHGGEDREPVVSRRSITSCASCSRTIPPAYDVDRTAGTNAIRQPLANLNEAGTLYGAIIYQKAPIVMRQLETLLGAERVPRRPARVPEDVCVRQRDVAGSDRAARRPHAGGPRGVEPRVGRGARTPDDPDRADDLERPDRRAWSLTQQDPIARRGLLWNQRMQVALGEGDETGHGHGFAATVTLLPVKLDAARVEVTAARGLPAQFVLPTAAASPTASCTSIAASLAWLIDQPAGDRRRADARQRVGHAVGRDARRRGRAADMLIALALRALPREANELNVQRMLVVSDARPTGQFTPARGPAGAGAAARARAARRACAGRVTEPEVGLVLRAARHRADAGDARVADARLEAAGERCRD